LRDKQETNEVR